MVITDTLGAATATGLPEPVAFRCESVWRHARPLLDMLRGEYGHLRLDRLAGTYGWCLRYDQLDKRAALGIDTLGELIDLFEAGDERPLPYLMHLSVNRNLLRLAPFFRHPPEFEPNWVTAPILDRLGGPEIFIGQRGTGFGPVHIDHAAVHVGFYQIRGKKKFLLFPPEDAPYLYTYRGAQFPWQMRNSRVRGVDDDSLRRFPMLANTHPREVTLSAGEALFLPANWWHTTFNLTDSVGYSVRIINRSNALRTVTEYALGIPRLLHKVLFGRLP